jgi:hypothetical protein
MSNTLQQSTFYGSVVPFVSNEITNLELIFIHHLPHPQQFTEEAV